MTKITCPCCDGDGEIEEPLSIRLPPVQALIYDIVRRVPEITGSSLTERVYASRPDGGPLWARRSIAVLTWHANRRLRDIGVRIQASSHGRGGDSTYRLVRL